MNLGDLLDHVPDLAVFTATTETSRNELVEQIDEIAGSLRTVGVGPGSVVGVMLGNRPATIATLFAVWRVGAVYAPFNPRASIHDVLQAMTTVQPTAIVTTEEHLARLDELLTGGTETVAGTAIRACRSPASEPQAEGVALIQFTSGTTGRPKPVPLRHDTVSDLLDKVVGTLRGRGGRSGGAGGDDARAPMPNLIPVSLSLWAGIYQVLFAFRVGAPVVLMDRFDTTEFAQLVATFGIRSTVLPPAAMTMLADDETIDDLSPLRIVRSISAPLSPAQARRFRDRFGVVVLNSYGQTELGGEVVGWSAADAREFGEEKLGSVGRPHAGVEVRACDSDGAPASPGESGELSVRTPATRSRSIAADFAERLTSDGWLRTGDIGRVDDEGFVWIEGRVSDMINRGGLKVFPAQVEEVLMTSPEVRDAAVVGVADDRLGEVPWAFVVPASSDLDTAQLMEWCRERLTPYKIPARIVEVAALPRNEAGKVLKRDLAALADS